PAYAQGINVTGLHLHFIDKSRSKAGHIIDFTLKSGTMQLGYLLDYRLILPDGGDFYGGDFTIDRSDEVDDVEG
ncbi:MAG: acetolactate decarboxylase, partial [Prolixibacteraceae bacterium]|nr:acetolactate decarboxylase [Prolixibacteraceae bacterium]